MRVYFKRHWKLRLLQTASLLNMAGLSVGVSVAQQKSLQPAQGSPTAAVQGKIVTPDGKPVKDAAVFWIERSAQGFMRRFTVDTDAQGQFRFSDASPPSSPTQHVILMVQSPDWGLTFRPLTAGAEASKPLTVTLQPPTALSISFLDQAEKPAPNLPIRVKALYIPEVGLLEIPAAMHGRWEQQTDAKGECVFPGLPQGAQVQFTVQNATFASLTYQDAVMLEKAPTQQARPVHLSLGGIVQGQVATATDRVPAAGIRVVAQATSAGEGWGEAVTDAQGRYRIGGLRPGAYNVALFLDGPHEKTLTARALAKIDVKPGSTLEKQDFALLPGFLITGKVTDKNSGKPMADVMIGLYGPAHPRSGAAVQVAKTDANGVYQARVPAGTNYVYVMGLPYGAATRYERPGEGVNLTVGAATALTQDFTMTPSPTQNLKPVKGRIVDADGKPIPKARLTVLPVGEDFGPNGREIEADDQGAFHLEMLSASVRLRARSGDMATEKTVLVQNGEEVTLQLKPNTLLTLSGQVRDAQGKPLADAAVTLAEWWLDSGLGNKITKTDAQGRFTFGGLYPDMRYSVSAEAKGYGTQSSPVMQYKPGEKGECAPLQLPRADSFVAGRVVDENGDPLAKQTVRLQGRTNKYQEAVTDAQGHFRFENVVDEPVTLYLVEETGFSPRKQAVAADKEIIIVRKAPKSNEATQNEIQRDENGEKKRTALLTQPGPPLKAVAWLNTKTAMPDSLKGKIVLIDFWAISCGPCVASLPAVQRVSEKLAGQDVAVVGLHASGADKATLADFIGAHKLTYPMAIDSEDPQHATFGQTMSSYGIVGIPMVAVLDRQGLVRYLNRGLDGALKVIGELLATPK